MLLLWFGCAQLIVIAPGISERLGWKRWQRGVAGREIGDSSTTRLDVCWIVSLSYLAGSWKTALTNVAALDFGERPLVAAFRASPGKG